MGKKHYELVKSLEEIIPIIKKYIDILKEFKRTGKEENGGRVIETFPTFDYWYYFDDISVLDDLKYIFIPNKFLGYKLHSKEPYNPPQVMNGKKARKALEQYFDVITSEEHEVLYPKLIKFTKENKSGVKKGVIIKKPNEKYKDELGKGILNETNLLVSNVLNENETSELTLVGNVNDIKPIIQRYIQYLKNKELDNGELFQNFKTFDYWYYFPELKIFVPNNFLGYKIHAIKPYNPEHGMNGEKARKALGKFFKEITNTDKRKPNILSKLEKFTKEYNNSRIKQSKKGITIFEPNNDLRNIIKKEILNETTTDISTNNDQKTNTGKPKAELIKKTKSFPLNGNKQELTSNIKFESSLEIAQRCEKLVIKINKIRIIFNKDNTQELWVYIREPVKSEADFFRSINKLYIIVKEDTRDPNPKFKPGKRNGPFYNDRFPDSAEKIKLFIGDVNKIRNCEDHKERRETRAEYLEVCKKYLPLKREPVKEEEFKEFQINILSQFETSLQELLDILLKE